MRILLTIMAATLLGAAATAAPLDPRGDPQIFMREIAAINAKPLPDGEPLARAVGKAVMFDARKRGRCAPARIKLGKLEPVTLDGMITGMIVSGEIENAWLLSVTLEDCPPADPIRVLLFRHSDGVSLLAAFAGQGETLAWPSLARDTTRSAVAKVTERLRSRAPDCRPADLTPTAIRIEQRSPDLGPSVYGLRLRGWWDEVWMFEPCDHRIAVPIRFTTDGNGGGGWAIDDARIDFLPAAGG